MRTKYCANMITIGRAGYGEQKNTRGRRLNLRLFTIEVNKYAQTPYADTSILAAT